MKQLLLFLVVLFLLFTSCDTTDPKPPEENLPGYQEDISWPSLADSPWPMYHGDPQATGRLKGTIPIFSKVEKTIEKYSTVSGAVVGEDSCFYFVSIDSPSGLVCLTPSGEQKWIFDLPKSFSHSNISTPLITKKGDIIFNYEKTDSVYSVSNEGKLNWRLSLNCKEQINIGIDGTIYAFSVAPTAINAINPSGILLWTLENNYIFPFTSSISPDGKMLYTLGVNGKVLIAIDISSQSIAWEIDKNIPSQYWNIAQPLIDNQGNVYIIMGESDNVTIGIYSFNSNGVERWKTLLPAEGINQFLSPAMDKNGNIYVGFKNLYKINYTGKILWEKSFDFISNELLVDNLNNILFTKNNANEIWLESLVLLNDKGEIVNQVDLPNIVGFQYFAPAVSYKCILMPVTFVKNFVLYIN